MSKMKSFQVKALTLSLLMIISMVKGRWLDFETYSTSMMSVGVHNISNDNPPNLRLEISNSSTFYAEKRCESLYGFFPCADTILESVFLMFMYMYFMILGEELMRIGSKVLFQWIGDKAFGESVFGVLKALPRIAVFVVPGVLSSTSDAQNQVGFGVSMYAGSTVITLTLMWGIRIILSRYKLKKRSSPESDLQQDSMKNRSSLKDKLPLFETDKDFNIDNETGYMAVIMLLSLIPFAFVGLLHFINTPAMTLFALIVSGVSLILYWVYQVGHPWIRYRSLAYLNEENLRTRFFYHVVWLADFEDLGDFGVTYFKRIFDEADKDEDGKITTKKNSAILPTYFTKFAHRFCGGEANVDNNKDEHISPNVNNNRDEHISHNVDNNKDEDISHNVDNNGDDRKPHDDELGELVQKMFMLEKKDEKSKEAVLIHFDTNNNGIISWAEFKRGCTNWLEEIISSGSVFENIWNQAEARNKQRSYIRITIDPKEAIEKFEKDNREKIHALLKPEKPKATIVYAIFGMAITIIITSPFIASVKQFSTAAHIPFLFTSFVIAPIAMKAKMVIVALLNVQHHVRKNASLTFSEIYNQLVMDNLIGFVSLLAVVYIRGLSWTYSAEVLAIMIPCAIVGVFAIKRDIYPLWASISAILLYPVSVYIYYVLPNAS